MVIKSQNHKNRLHHPAGRWLALVLAGLVLGACAGTAREIRPEKAAIDPSVIRPGLAVLYFEDFYRHINEMPTGDRALKEGRPGRPIPYLNYRFGEGVVFDSGLNRGVGVQMSGFIHFPVPGKYLFKTRSNDGIRIFINAEKMIDDPDVHSDRFSGDASVDIQQPGWYPLRAQYFQRKGTSMLELYWQMPGRSDFEIVPAESFGHAAARA